MLNIQPDLQFFPAVMTPSLGAPHMLDAAICCEFQPRRQRDCLFFSLCILSLCTDCLHTLAISRKKKMRKKEEVKKEAQRREGRKGEKERPGDEGAK